MEKRIAIYKIVNTEGIVEYVGQSVCPEHRFNQHTIAGVGWIVGKFVGRSDVRMEIIEWITGTRKEAFKIEAYWQEYYGFVPERTRAKTTSANRTEEEKLQTKIKTRNTVLSDPEKDKEAHRKHWDTVNANPEKKKIAFKKMIESRDEEKRVEKLKEYIKNMDPEAKKIRYQKVWETRRLNKIKKNDTE